MLRVTIEVVPFGMEEAKRTLHEIEIANVCEFGDNSADYSVRERGSKMDPYAVVGFDRGRGALALVAEATRVLEAHEGRSNGEVNEADEADDGMCQCCGFDVDDPRFHVCPSREAIEAALGNKGRSNGEVSND